jgi:hypothetical protein
MYQNRGKQPSNEIKEQEKKRQYERGFKYSMHCELLSA